MLRTGKLDAASADILRQEQATSNTIDFWSEAAPGRLDYNRIYIVFYPRIYIVSFGMQ